MTDKKKIYILGPMRGKENYNFDAFDKARDFLTEIGFMPISPADLDRFYENWEMYPPEGFVPSKELMRDMIMRDLEAVSTSQAVYALKGWEDSKGSAVEMALAKFLDLEIIIEQ